MGKPTKILFARAMFAGSAVIVIPGRPSRQERFRRAAAAEAVRRRRQKRRKVVRDAS